jgi:ElaB/YqjD/DUF883 family membrane-anchored ribosome-binding protein
METYFPNILAEQGTREKLVHDLITLVHDAEDLVRATGENLAAKSRDDLIAALERVKASCRKLEAQASMGANNADKLIRENPYRSVGVAFGIGLLLGVLVARD